MSTEGTTTTAVWTVGCGHDGRLGHGDEVNRSTWKRIARMSNDSVGAPRAIAAGGFHTFVICQRGVLAYGFNEDGQLGLGDRVSRKTPVVVDFFGDGSGVVSISCGSYHTAALMADGSLYVTGKNGNGQLGLGDTDFRHRFTKVTSIDNARVLNVSCGSYHTLACVAPTDGVAVLMACGRGDYGELGYDPDPWDVAAQREQSIKNLVVARAHASSHLAGSSPRGGGDSGGTAAAPMIKFKAPKPAVKRRDPFFRTTLSIVKLPFEIVPESYYSHFASPAEGDGIDTVPALVRAAGDALPHLPDSTTVKAMYNHSAFRGIGSRAWWSFGCYYCDAIEDITSSVPRLLLPPTGAASPVAGVHAVEEAFFCWTETGDIYVRGKGLLTATGDEDGSGWCSDWTMVLLPPCVAQAQHRRIEWMRGSTQVWVKFIVTNDGEGSPDNRSVVFLAAGDNYFGQLATADENCCPRFVEIKTPPGRILDLQPGHRHTALLVEEA